jgi:hypothetical protein
MVEAASTRREVRKKAIHRWVQRWVQHVGMHVWGEKNKSFLIEKLSNL